MFITFQICFILYHKESLRNQEDVDLCWMRQLLF